MPPRINRPNLALRQFAAQADAAQGLNNRVIFRNGRLQTASGVSAFFAGSEARRATVEAFKRSIIREYGQTVGALDAFYAAHPRLTPALRDDMRELVLAQLQTFGVLDDQNLNDPFKLFDDVSQGNLTCMNDKMAACGELPESAFYPYRD